MNSFNSKEFYNKLLGKATYTRMIAGGYFLVILLGTLLLLLPFATQNGQSTNFLTALFTASSATCVTGLVVVDTYMHWTWFGKVVILCMIQIGGLGFMTMGVLLAMFFKKKITLRTRGLLQESINTNQVGGVVRLVRLAIKGTLILEGIGAVILAIRFIPIFGVAKGIAFGVFHAVSAFCNGGFDLMGGYSGEYSSLVAFSDDITVNVVIMALITLGGIGFTVWSDIKSNLWHYKKYSFHTKLVLLATAVLLIAGSILFFLFEKDHLMAGMSVKETILTSAFSSVTARTAGFNTVDTAALTPGSKLLTIILMFIGGSPGSTAGGIKTVTMMVLLVYVWSNLRGAKGYSIFGRRFEEEAVKKASNVMLISLLMAMGAALLISLFQPLAMEDVMFEIFSAIGTVGMTTGVTRELTTGSQIVIILLMYCGRIGSMSFALSFTERKKVPPVQSPAEKVMIG